jgi:hypothetical protein
MPHGVGLDVGTILALAPHPELRRMVGAEGEGGDGIKADVAGAVGVEQFRRELAEPQVLLDVPFGVTAADRYFIDRGAAVDQGRHCDKFVGRMPFPALPRSLGQSETAACALDQRQLG